MYISDTKTVSRADPVKKTVRAYTLASLLTACAGHIYEHFSHGVYARGMFWAFLIPLIAGAAVFVGISLLGPGVIPSGGEAAMYHSGVATLTVGSIFKGALDIYGTTSGLTGVYTLAGAALMAAGAAAYIVKLSRFRSGSYRF